MKYEKESKEAFDRLGFQPRTCQLEAVNKILTAFIDNKAENIILNAPTGAGKSVIGAVVAEALSILLGHKETSIKSSILLTATNVLAKQYANTFKSIKDKKLFLQIKGASNYACEALSTPEEYVTAESCAYYTMLQHRDEFKNILDNVCSKCEFLKTKEAKNSIRHLATNYSYYFVDRMYTKKLEYRDIVIWDEAQLINELFCDHNAINFSKKKLQSMLQEIGGIVDNLDIKISKALVSIASACSKPDKINESNYETYLQALSEVYTYAKDKGALLAERALKSRNISLYSKLNRFSKKYEGLCCKIGDFFTYKYDHVFEYKEKEMMVTVKPIFVNNMIDVLKCSPRNMFMSATISKEFMVNTLNLEDNKTEFIKLPSNFPKENKQIVFFDPLVLNYRSLQDTNTINKLCNNVLKIVKKHTEDNERGVILTPSFALQEQIVNYLQPLIKDKKLSLFEHKRGEHLVDVLEAFKRCEDKHAILVSPAMFEGVDLPDELSRFQILVKAPFPSLADKRMKFILDKFPNLYSLMTLMKIIQGAGRSVRNDKDFAVTYILDKNAQRLFSSSQNIWTDEFMMRYTSFI